MITARAVLGIVFVATAVAAAQPPVVLQNAHVRHAISADGKNLEFSDRATGHVYLRRDPPWACAVVRLKGKERPWLFEEIARNHADIVNACGFDGIYLDALDGSSTPRGDPAPLRQGPNQIRFSCDNVEGPAPRAEVVVIAYGNQLCTQ